MLVDSKYKRWPAQTTCRPDLSENCETPKRRNSTDNRPLPQRFIRGVADDLPRVRSHYLRFEVDHIVVLADDGTTEERNLQLLCSYCNRVKGTKGKDGYRLKMAELRADSVATGVMVDEGMAVLTEKRLARLQPRGSADVTGWLRRLPVHRKE